MRARSERESSAEKKDGLFSDGPTQFDFEQFVLRDQREIVTHSNDPLPPAIPNDVEVITGLDSPPKASIQPNVLRLVVVLDKATENELRCESEDELCLPKPLSETAFPNPAVVVGGCDPQLKPSLPCVELYIMIPLCQATAVERPHPGG